MSRYLGRKNTIPNVSSAIFRKPDLAPPLQDSNWLLMKICDWIFYLHVLKVARSRSPPDTSNYFRLHRQQFLRQAPYLTPDLLQGARGGACEIARHYKVPAETLEANRFYVERFFNNHAAALIASGTMFDDVRQ